MGLTRSTKGHKFANPPVSYVCNIGKCWVSIVMLVAISNSAVKNSFLYQGHDRSPPVALITKVDVLRMALQDSSVKNFFFFHFRSRPMMASDSGG